MSVHGFVQRGLFVKQIGEIQESKPYGGMKLYDIGEETSIGVLYVSTKDRQAQPRVWWESRLPALQAEFERNNPELAGRGTDPKADEQYTAFLQGQQAPRPKLRQRGITTTDSAPVQPVSQPDPAPQPVRKSLIRSKRIEQIQQELKEQGLTATGRRPSGPVWQHLKERPPKKMSEEEAFEARQKASEVINPRPRLLLRKREPS